MLRNSTKGTVSANDTNAYDNTFSDRGNNPGDLRPTFPPFNGTIGTINLGSSGTFTKFSDVRYGIRAIGVNLNTYLMYGINTIDNIVNHFAPAADSNNTNAYKSFLVNNLNDKGFTIDVNTNLADLFLQQDFVSYLVHYIIMQETGKDVDVNFINYSLFEFDK
jgi:hypothetical protein